MQKIIILDLYFTYTFPNKPPKSPFLIIVQVPPKVGKGVK